MDVEDLDDVFSESSEGLLALISGIAIIITITFFIYEIVPFFSDHPMIFLFSVSSLIVCVVSSISFYLSDITLLPDVLGKLITGLTITIFAVVLFHVGRTYGMSSLPEVVLIGFLGFASALPLARGVLIPLFGEGEVFEVSESEEEFEDIEEDEVGFEHEIEEGEDGSASGGEEEIEEETSFSQKNEPW